MIPQKVFVFGLLMLGPAFVQYEMGQEAWTKATRLARQDLASSPSPTIDVPQCDVDKIPSIAGALTHFGLAALCLLVSFGCVYYTCVIHLDCFGLRKSPSMLEHQSRPIDLAKLKKSEAKNLAAKSPTFISAGYKSLGCVETTVLRSRWREALFLAPDGLGIVSIALENPLAEPVAIGVLEDGTCFSFSANGEQETIDGTDNGIPLMINTFPEATPVEVIQGFEQLKRLLSAQARVVAIDTKAVIGLLQYRMQLKGWWAVFKGFSTITPDPLPSVSEIICYRASTPIFCWGSSNSNNY